MSIIAILFFFRSPKTTIIYKTIVKIKILQALFSVVYILDLSLKGFKVKQKKNSIYQKGNQNIKIIHNSFLKKQRIH